MHNLPLTSKGSDACAVQIAPQDVARIGVSDGDKVRIYSRVGEVEVLAAVTSDLMPGAVSLPHGYGHAAPGMRSRMFGLGSILTP